MVPKPPPIQLHCPEDGSPLHAAENRHSCPACGAEYPVERGVVRFLRDSDAFYEGRYDNTIRFVPRTESLRHAWPLWLINSGYLWAVRRHVAEGGTIVEMGSGSCIAYFAQRFQVIGLDLSLSSLAAVAGLYDACVQADVTRGVPLPDGSVDAITSSYVWEHIPPDQKPAALAECARVLKPGGVLVFLYDVECRNPLYRRMKESDPERYQETLIDREGHLGWQTPAENLAVFESHGFRVRSQLPREKLFISPAMYEKVAEWGGGLERIARLGMRFRAGLPFQLYNGGVRAFDATLGHLLPDAWARVAITVCEKRQAA